MAITIKHPKWSGVFHEFTGDIFRNFSHSRRNFIEYWNAVINDGKQSWSYTFALTRRPEITAKDGVFENAIVRGMSVLNRFRSDKSRKQVVSCYAPVASLMILPDARLSHDLIPQRLSFFDFLRKISLLFCHLIHLVVNVAPQSCARCEFRVNFFISPSGTINLGAAFLSREWRISFARSF